MRWIVVRLIRLYQALISPRKGFSCAYRIVHGGESCSDAIIKIVIQKGFISGFEDIRARFSDCSNAASVYRSTETQNNQRVLDCGGIDSCADPLSGCGDFFGGGSVDGGTGGGQGPSTGSSSTHSIILIPIGLLTTFLILCFFGWSYGQEVSSIHVRLLENTTESSDQYLGKLVGGELPDYQLVLTAVNKEIKTNTHKNVSAKDWLIFFPKNSIKKSDIKTISILEKDLFGDKVLDVIEVLKKTGSGEMFEYEIEKNWNFL